MEKKEIIYTIILIIVGILTRTILHIAPNVEFVTVISLSAGYFLNKRKNSFLIPFTIMAITDMIIGNTSIFLFTWSAFLFTPVLGIVTRKIQNKFKLKENILKVSIITATGVLSTLIFFLWTNFGVWLISGMYQNNLSGLTQCYVNALPFLRNQLFGNLIIVPMVFTLSLILMKENYRKNLDLKRI